MVRSGEGSLRLARSSEGELFVEVERQAGRTARGRPAFPRSFSPGLDPFITFNLAPDDDPHLWEVATNTILGEAGRLCGEIREDVFAQVGCCRHWICPHGSIWWPADGGFAWPFGYDKITTDFFQRPAKSQG